MEFAFDLTSLEAYLNNDSDPLVMEQLLLSDSMAITHDIVLDSLYEKRSRTVGATQAHEEIEELRQRFVVWNYPMFDVEAALIAGIYDLPYSAAVCVAISRQSSCPIITASHFLFDPVMENEVCGVLFTR